MTETARVPSIAFDPLDSSFAMDPRPFYHQLRAIDPVYWWEEERAWMVTGYWHGVLSTYGAKVKLVPNECSSIRLP